MAKQLRKLQRRRSSSSDSETQSSGEGSSGGHRHSGPSKLKAVLRLRERVKRHPLRILTNYRSRCLRRLGIYALPNGMLSAPYTHPSTSLHLRPSFGRMTGLWRCHFAMSHVLELMEHRRVEEAAATAVQVLKAIHQTALDGGSWNSSTDPLAKDLFGGDAEEMMATAAWNRGVKDLQSQVASLSHSGPAGHEGEEAAPRRSRLGTTRHGQRSEPRPPRQQKAKAAAAQKPGAGGAG